MTLADLSIRLFTAFLAGAFIGIERQWHHRMAGLRTNVLVSIGACLFVLLPFFTIGDSSPNRVASQVVSGIGFLGAGVILRDGLSVRGLNTAATLWCSAAVGVLAGAGLYVISLIGAFTVLLINTILRSVSEYFNKKSCVTTRPTINYHLHATCHDLDREHVRILLMYLIHTENMCLKKLYSENISDSSKVTVSAYITSQENNEVNIEKIIGRLSLEKGIFAIGWEAILDPGEMPDAA
jgi:putative Mg2+ transporter-C (MgtC) family protein